MGDDPARPDGRDGGCPGGIRAHGIEYQVKAGCFGGFRHRIEDVQAGAPGRLPTQGIGLREADLTRPPGFEDQAAQQPHRTAADHQGAALRQGPPTRPRRQHQGVPCGGAGFRQCRLGGLQVAGHRDEVAVRNRDSLREGARPAHADQFARRTEVRPPALAIVAAAAGDEGIEHDPCSGFRPIDHSAAGLVPQDERWHPARVVAVPGMHVGAADADRIDRDQRLPGTGIGRRLVAVFGLLCGGIDQRLHASLTSR